MGAGCVGSGGAVRRGREIRLETSYHTGRRVLPSSYLGRFVGVVGLECREPLWRWSRMKRS